jgi:hypothetical protein
LGGRTCAKGCASRGTALDAEGKLVTGAKGASVTDGAFAESKDPIAGYFKLAVSSTEEAVRLAQACPILAYGAQLEVGPLPTGWVRNELEKRP